MEEEEEEEVMVVMDEDDDDCDHDDHEVAGEGAALVTAEGSAAHEPVVGQPADLADAAALGSFLLLTEQRRGGRERSADGEEGPPPPQLPPPPYEVATRSRGEAWPHFDPKTLYDL